MGHLTYTATKPRSLGILPLIPTAPYLNGWSFRCAAAPIFRKRSIVHAAKIDRTKSSQFQLTLLLKELRALGLAYELCDMVVVVLQGRFIAAEHEGFIGF